MPDNQTNRIRAAQFALDAHQDAKRSFGVEQEERVTDLLTDLRHLCDAEDLDFTALIRRSKMNHSEEQV
jgi:hypothetical protein